MKRPIEESYWVDPGKLLAGGYPAGWNKKHVRELLTQLLRGGITFFVDFTEEGEKRLITYQPLLYEATAKVGVSAEYRRLPIRDFDVPDTAQMRQILGTLEKAIAQDHTIYIHCYAGIGRTGTVAGCYLVEQGMSGQEALVELARLRKDTPFWASQVPVTNEQRTMVLHWAEQ